MEDLEPSQDGILKEKETIFTKQQVIMEKVAKEGFANYVGGLNNSEVAQERSPENIYSAGSGR